jgi:hypothetical protein
LEQREQITAASTIVAERGKEFHSALDALDWASSDAQGSQKRSDGAYLALQNALDQLAVQIALALSPEIGSIAGYAKTIADTSCGVTAEFVSWKRIGQLNENSGQNLRAVAALTERLKAVVQQMPELEKKSAGDYRNRCSAPQSEAIAGSQ